MAKKGISTETSPMDWDHFRNLIKSMTYDIDHSKESDSKRKLQSRFLMFISIGCYCGLRASDLLVLKWDDLLDKKQLEVTEKKTGKKRNITLNEKLMNIVNINSGNDIFMFLRKWRKNNGSSLSNMSLPN